MSGMKLSRKKLISLVMNGDQLLISTSSIEDHYILD